jgi:branched-chain amino acid transport system permease protein
MPVQRLQFFGWRLSGSETWYWISGAVMTVGAWFALNVQNSPTGRAFRALHNSEIAARVLGVDVAAFKLKAFVISAVYASVAGSLLACTNGLVTPDSANFLHSVELVTIVVVGGLGSVLGSVVGAAVLITLPQILTLVHEYENLMLGLIIMLAMIFLKRGIVPSLATWLPRGAPG